MSALLINFQAAKKAYMIQATNIQKFYGDLQVLKGVDLHIKKGEIVSIVGPSGAGKTTLLQILGTLDVQSNKLDSRLLINAIEVSDLSDKELARFRNEHIGFIFQFHQLLPEFTALENVCIPAYIKKTPKSEVQRITGIFGACTAHSPQTE
jgi:lipoprotein-releasing system ATP-binding protein